MFEVTNTSKKFHPIIKLEKSNLAKNSGLMNTPEYFTTNDNSKTV